MKKSILNLAGAQELSKKEQKTINGGITQACATAIANGCVKTTASNCLNNGGLYNKACACCNY